MNREDREERDIRTLCRALAHRGKKVRRENLIRGTGFKARSGDCIFLGMNTVFVDRRLPVAQQLSLVVDYFISTSTALSQDEFEKLSSSTQKELRVVVSPP